jgi:hypothetical protein
VTGESGSDPMLPHSKHHAHVNLVWKAEEQRVYAAK